MFIVVIKEISKKGVYDLLVYTKILSILFTPDTITYSIPESISFSLGVENFNNVSAC